MHIGWLFFATGVLICTIAYQAPAGDFTNYYFGSWFLRSGQFTTAIYDPYQFNCLIRAAFRDPFFANYTPVPPITAILGLPLTFMPFFLSRFVFNLIGLSFCAVAITRTLRRRKMLNPALYFLPVLFFVPLYSNLSQGQWYLFLLAAILESLQFYEGGRKSLASALLAGAIALKLSPVVLLLFYLFRNDVRMIIMTTGFTILFSLAPIVFMDYHIITAYFSEILPRLASGEINNPYASSYQSMAVFLRQRLVFDKLLNNAHRCYAPNLFHWLNVAFIISFSVPILYWAKLQKNTLLQWGGLLLLGIVVSGYGTTYGLLLLIPASLILLEEIASYKIPLGLLVLACLLPVSRFAQMPGIFAFPRLLALLALVLYIIARHKPFLIVAPTIWSLVAISTMVYSCKMEPAISDLYVLQEQHDLLLYDFSKAGDSLQLFFYTDKGPQIINTPSAEIVTVDTVLEIRDNQLFDSGRQLTFDNSRKKGPVRLRQRKEIWFLSDRNRGVGFYTINRIRY